MRADHRIRHLMLVLLTVAVADARAATVNLGDLNVPSDRIPNFYPFDESVYNAARSWPEYDVTCASAPCPSGRLPFTADPALDGTCSAVSTGNYSEMDCMVDNASDNGVLFLPPGTYSVPQGDALTIGRSNIVVRGAGVDSTIVQRDERGRESVGGDCGSNEGGWAFSVCHAGFWGSQTDWTGGYGRGTTTVALEETGAFSVGGWILLRMSGSTACEYMDETLSSGSNADGFVHIARITNISGNNVSMDRGLRMNYVGAGCTGHEAIVYTPVENVGVERIRFTSSPSTQVCKTDPCIRFTPVTFAGAANSWFVDSQVDRSWEMWVKIKYAARNWIQGNNFENLDETIEFNTEGMYQQQGAVDNVWENNYCTGARVCQKIDNGAEGTVTAYNYMRQDQSICERAYFVHGHYGRENLTEGNDIDCALHISDSWWGRNGPRNTAYRNRNVSTVCEGARDTLTLSEAGGDGWPAGTYVNMIGNTSGQYVAFPVQNNPPCAPSVNNSADLSTLSPNIWLENNAWRYPGGTFDHGSANGRSCGTGPGDSCPGTNHNTDRPHSSWSGAYPTSLYRTQAPNWWCQEACPWSPGGIGAFGDDFGTSLCKLPAQIRVEGGTCTPPSIDVPAAPILLP